MIAFRFKITSATTSRNVWRQTLIKAPLNTLYKRVQRPEHYLKLKT